MARHKKLIAFDMDGTLLEGRIIQALAEKYDFTDKLYKIQSNQNMEGYQKSQKIAYLLKGRHADEVTKITSEMKLIKNWRQAIYELQSHDYVLGIISDSYKFACDYLAEKMNLDFVIANDLKVDENDCLTGDLVMPFGWEKIGCSCKISVCKRYHLEKMAQFEIDIRDTAVVGDTVSDLCMIKRAGTGIAMMPKDRMLEDVSDVVIKTHDLNQILPFVL
jgi:phosphoserine phosphatase